MEFDIFRKSYRNVQKTKQKETIKVLLREERDSSIITGYENGVIKNSCLI